MRVRTAKLPDVPALVALGQEFIKEAPNYQKRPYMADKAAEHFTHLINGGGVIFIVEQDQEITNCLLTTQMRDRVPGF